MTRIDAASELAALIRRQFGQAQAQGTQRSAVPAAKTSATKTSARNPAENSAALIAQRVRAIPADDPQRRRKAFRVFLESALLNELGDSLINDPGFYRLVDRVEQQMTANPQLSEAIDAAAEMLLKA